MYDSDDADASPMGRLRSQESLIQKFENWDRDIDLKTATWRQEARMWFAMVAGEQWDAEDKAELIDNFRVPAVFNRAEPMVDAITGAEVANRQQTAFYGREIGDARAEEVVGAAIDYERDASDASDEDSDAARDALICGLGWVEHRLTDEEDPKGSIVWAKTDVFEMAADPHAKRKNLVDARYVRRKRDLTKEEYAEFCEEIGAIGAEDEGGGSSHDDRGMVKHNEPNDGYEAHDESADHESDTVTVREYQWYGAKEVTEESDWRVQDPTTGKQEVLSARQYQRLVQRFARFGMELQAEPIAYRPVYRAYVCGKKLLGNGAHRLPKVRSFLYKAITGKRDQVRGTWYGVLRSLVDPQRFVNSLFSQILHIIDASAKAGYWYESGAFVDPDWEDRVAEVGADIELAPGALTEGKVKSRVELNWPAGYDRLLQFVWDSFPWVSGVNPNLFGMSNEAGESGVLDAQRTRQAYGVLQWWFDSIKRYRKLSGRLTLELLSLIDEGKLVRVVGEHRTQYVPLVFDGEVRKYDIVVDEAPDSPQAQDRIFALMLQLAPIIKDIGPLPPEAMADFIQHSPLPASVKEKIVAKMRQPNPDQQKAKQLQEAKITADVQKTRADAQLSQARARSEGQADPLEQLKIQAGVQQTRLDVAKANMDARMTAMELEGEREERAHDRLRMAHEGRMMIAKERQMTRSGESRP